MSSTSNYLEFAPGFGLADRIVCVWSQHVDRTNAGLLQPVFPDGCVDILWRDDRAPVVLGAMTRHRQAALRPGLRLVGLRLLPGQAAALLGMPANELTDIEAPLGELIGPGKHTAPWTGPAPDSRHPIKTISERVGALLNRRADPWMLAAVDGLVRLNVVARGHRDGVIKELADELGMSERQLNRRFTAAVGYGPKLFQRILRFQRLLDLAARPNAPGLAELAYDAGYADQAHMSRDCRALAGRSPAELFATANSASSLDMSDLFNT